MATISLRYVTTDRDRHGNVRFYFRRPGKPKVRLSGLPGSAEFMEAYQEALAGLPKPDPARSQLPKPGSFRAACVGFYASPKFLGLDKSTKGWLRRSLDGVAQEHGDNALALMKPRHVRQLRDGKAATPAAAKTLLKALRAMFK